MTTERVKVWVQSFKDRPFPMLQWHDPDTGRRKSVSTGTNEPKAIEQARSDKEYELNHGLHAEKSRMTWKRFRELFEEEYLPRLRERTREKYVSVLDAIEDEMKPTKLAQVDERFVSRLENALRNRKVIHSNRHASSRASNAKVSKIGFEPVTIRNYLVAFRKAISWGVEQGFLNRMPKFPKVKVPKKKPQAIPAEAFERLVEATTDPVWKAYIQCAWWSGLRLTEAWKLRWAPSERFPYVDLDAGRIVLPAEFAKSAVDQWVPIHSTLRKLFEELPRTNDEVFPLRGFGGRPITRGSISSKVCRLARKAGVKLSMHKLRKGFGCRVASQLGKGNAPVLHQLMRHSSMQITMDYYANVDDVLSQAIEQIG